MQSKNEIAIFDISPFKAEVEAVATADTSTYTGERKGHFDTI